MNNKYFEGIPKCLGVSMSKTSPDTSSSFTVYSPEIGEVVEVYIYIVVTTLSYLTFYSGEW
jgi:hypothetical protein